ncbi:MAG: CorA-like magnesium transport protein [Frankiales bacterium]|jgi:magnesium transporter|nr:CorA-like magnesium transport protein [Frankiales bacterium]
MTIEEQAPGRHPACRATSPTSCEAATRLYRAGVLVAEGFPVEDISVHLAEPDTVVWLDLLQPSLADMDVLIEEFGLHPLAIEDALHDHQRPKLDRYDDHAFLAAYAVSCSPGESLLRTAEVAAFLTPRALITVRKDRMLQLEPLLARWDGARELAASGVAYLAHGLVDHLVDGHSAAVEVLDDEAEDLEDLLFSDGSQGGDLQRRSFELRKALTSLRRAVLPMRDVLAVMHRPDVGLSDERMAPYLRDVDDHVQRAASDIDGLRDLLGTILDTNLTLASNRLNETIFRLTAYAAILAATTAVTGYFGQNVPFPGSQQTSGFIASTVLLIGSVVGLFVFFRRKGWL